MERTRPLEIGPLFSKDIANQEAEVILDDNDENPANEQTWLDNFADYSAEVARSEADFFAEFSRKKKV